MSKLKAFFRGNSRSSRPIGRSVKCPLLLGLAILGVAVGVVRVDLLDDLGLVLAVGALGDLGEVEVLDREPVDVELERPAHRSEIGLAQRGAHRLHVRHIALHRIDRAGDQMRRVVGLHRV